MRRWTFMIGLLLTIAVMPSKARPDEAANFEAVTHFDMIFTAATGEVRGCGLRPEGWSEKILGKIALRDFNIAYNLWPGDTPGNLNAQGNAQMAIYQQKLAETYGSGLHCSPEQCAKISQNGPLLDALDGIADWKQ